ncbi:hypothetical protein HD806DRAFT_540718 [Xylariaceae sp. AK1471]|nr:hypothetical protein HD806DRAFT_540718 [Xylariaceae sp. AK1471]
MPATDKRTFSQFENGKSQNDNNNEAAVATGRAAKATESSTLEQTLSQSYSPPKRRHIIENQGQTERLGVNDRGRKRGGNSQFMGVEAMKRRRERGRRREIEERDRDRDLCLATSRPRSQSHSEPQLPPVPRLQPPESSSLLPLLHLRGGDLPDLSFRTSALMTSSSYRRTISLPILLKIHGDFSPLYDEINGGNNPESHENIHGDNDDDSSTEKLHRIIVFHFIRNMGILVSGDADDMLTWRVDVDISVDGGITNNGAMGMLDAPGEDEAPGAEELHLPRLPPTFAKAAKIVYVDYTDRSDISDDGGDDSPGAIDKYGRFGTIAKNNKNKKNSKFTSKKTSWATNDKTPAMKGTHIDIPMHSMPSRTTSTTTKSPPLPSPRPRDASPRENQPATADLQDNNDPAVIRQDQNTEIIILVICIVLCNCANWVLWDTYLDAWQRLKQLWLGQGLS